MIAKRIPSPRRDNPRKPTRERQGDQDFADAKIHEEGDTQSM